MTSSTIAHHAVTQQAPLPPLVVFLHVPKTAGSSLRDYFAKAFPDAFLEAGRAESEDGQPVIGRRGRPVAGVEAFYGPAPPVGPAVRGLAGHMMYRRLALESLGRDLLYVSVIRDPVSRVLSAYNFHRSITKHVLHEEVAGKTLFEAIQQSPRWTRKIDDRQTRQLFGAQAPSAVLGKEKFIIGKLEHLPRFLAEIADIVPGTRRRCPAATPPPGRTTRRRSAGSRTSSRRSPSSATTPGATRNSTTASARCWFPNRCRLGGRRAPANRAGPQSCAAGPRAASAAPRASGPA